MSGRLRQQGGMLLVELLLAATLLIVVLGATLGSLTTFESNSRINELQNDNQEAVREAIDQMARELRNHAVATQQAPQGIVKLNSYDLVIQSVAPTKPSGSANAQNIDRLRYCLDYSNPRQEVLWSQSQTWTTASPPAVPSTASCPDPAWGNQRMLADKIVNRFALADRAMFTPNSATLGQITRIDLTIFLDTTPGGGPINAPDETRIDSGIFMRNQNQPPTASFSAAVTGSRHIVLNASNSNDAENQSLTYTWTDGGTAITGSGQTVDYPVTTPGNHTIGLTVTDPGGLSATASQVVNVP